jgi:hypothetical protein
LLVERFSKNLLKYLAVVGELDPTPQGDELESPQKFKTRFKMGKRDADRAISDALLDKFALAGTADDALAALARMDGKVSRFEFGTPHGLGTRPAAIRYPGEAIVNEAGGNR